MFCACLPPSLVSSMPRPARTRPTSRPGVDIVAPYSRQHQPTPIFACAATEAGRVDHRPSIGVGGFDPVETTVAVRLHEAPDLSDHLPDLRRSSPAARVEPPLNS